MELQVLKIFFTILLLDSITRTQAGLLEKFGSIFKPDIVESKTINPFQVGNTRGFDTSYGRARGWRNSWVNRPNTSQQDIGKSDPNMKDNTLLSIKLLKRLRDLGNNGPKTENVTEPTVTKTIGIDATEEAIDSATAKAKEVKVLKPLTKKQFYFQVQPVVPEGERTGRLETIYYVD